MMELKNLHAKTVEDLDIEMTINSCVITNPADEVNENKVEEVDNSTIEDKVEVTDEAA